MVSLKSTDIHKAYGIDLQDLFESCSDAHVGVVTPSGVTWRGKEGRKPPPGEGWLVEILRSRGDRECLFLQVDGGSCAALRAHLQMCPAEVQTYWFPRNRCACLMVRNEPAVV